MVGDAFDFDQTVLSLNNCLSPESVDFVNCQFALHYAFETKARALQAFRTMSHFLKKGGRCVVTVRNFVTL